MYISPETRAKIDEIVRRGGHLYKFLDVPAKQARLAELEAKMAEPDFWNDQQAAQAVISESTSLKSAVTPLVAICAMCFIGALMVSSVPYCNAKRLNKHNVNKVKLYGMTTFIVLCFVVLREKAFLAVALMYIISGLVRFDGAAWIMLDAEDERSAEDKE